MKLQNFSFRFLGGVITVQAFNKQEGKILAQAEAIRRGWSYEVKE